MKILVNSMTQNEFEQYLMKIVECAFREGVLWEKCGGENFISLYDAIKSTQMNIIVDGNL